MDDNTKKIKQLENEISYLESSVEVAEKYPTETVQFYNALNRQQNELQDKRRELEQLKRGMK